MNDDELDRLLQGIELPSNQELAEESRSAKISLATTGKKVSQTTRQRLRAANLGTVKGPMTDDQKRKISQAHTGKKFTEEHIENMRKANLGKTLSEETRAKISAGGKGRIVSDETRLKLSAANSGDLNCSKRPEVRAKISEAIKAKPKLTCPHCKKETNEINARRWHFDNCKLVKSRDDLKLECPHCGKKAAPGNAKKYHFENCKKKPTK